MARHVPRFLQKASVDPDSRSGSYTGMYMHNVSEFNANINAPAHVRWWPGASADVQTVALFIPGNPGLIDFYIPFLSALHGLFEHDGLDILAHAHIGHTPFLTVSEHKQQPGLLHQVKAALDFFNAIQACWPDTKIVLIGHSVGAWIAEQVLKARPDAVNALFMLFPTISNIARTPNGRRLSWLFNPRIAYAVSQLSVLIRPIASPVLSLLYPSWPARQKAVLRSFLFSPQGIFASLTMARDEMHIITALDVSFLSQHSSKLWFYYAERDDWVGKERESVMQVLREPAAFRTVPGIPHAFCILHSNRVAAQCANWLKQGGFLKG